MTSSTPAERAHAMWEAVMDNYPGGRNATNFGKWLDPVAGPDTRYSGIKGTILRLTEFLIWVDDVSVRVPFASPRLESDTVWFGPSDQQFGIVATVGGARLFVPSSPAPLRAIFAGVDASRACVLYQLGMRLDPESWRARTETMADAERVHRPEPSGPIFADLPLWVPTSPDIDTPWTEVADDESGREVAIADAIGPDRLLAQLEAMSA